MTHSLAIAVPVEKKCQSAAAFTTITTIFTTLSCVCFGADVSAESIYYNNEWLFCFCFKFNELSLMNDEYEMTDECY